jgi:hypothetical protein
VSLGDSIRNFFSRRSNPELPRLEAFALGRRGVEGYIEPETATVPTTLLLVDREGDHARAAVKDPRAAAAFCEKLGVPVYDAQVIGYPERMRNFDKRRSAAESQFVDNEIAELERRMSEPGSDTPND